MSRVYALIDRDLLQKSQISIEQVASFLQQNRIKIAQYRNKSPKNRDEILNDLEKIRELFSGDLIINDHIEFIDFVDGLHLGQEDLKSINPEPEEAVEIVRERIGKKILGLSTHNLEEILEANSLDLDYIGLGAYRATATKEQVEVAGSKLLDYARESKHPVAIIGGVRLDDEFGAEISMRVVGSDIIKKIRGSFEQI
jgi:thiamine-phosphate pyrophosphorylase